MRIEEIEVIRSIMKIKKNMGTMDRALRIGLGIVLLILSFYSTGWMTAILVVAGIFCLYEGAASWCVVYQLLGKNTCPIKRK